MRCKKQRNFVQPDWWTLRTRDHQPPFFFSLRSPLHWIKYYKCNFHFLLCINSCIYRFKPWNIQHTMHIIYAIFTQFSWQTNIERESWCFPFFVTGFFIQIKKKTHFDVEVDYFLMTRMSNSPWMAHLSLAFSIILSDVIWCLSSLLSCWCIVRYVDHRRLAGSRDHQHRHHLVHDKIKPQNINWVIHQLSKPVEIFASATILSLANMFRTPTKQPSKPSLHSTILYETLFTRCHPHKQWSISESNGTAWMSDKHRCKKKNMMETWNKRVCHLHITCVLIGLRLCLAALQFHVLTFAMRMSIETDGFVSITWSIKIH